MFVQEDIKKIFEEKDIEIKDKDIEKPPSSAMGDFSTTICFKLAKQWGKKPQEIAQKLRNELKPKGVIRSIKCFGPYLNFFIDRDKFAEKVVAESLKKNYGKGKKKKEKVMVEYANANTHKPLHVGHLRNFCLGYSMSRILEYYGHEVVDAYYINDSGAHVAKFIWYFKNFYKKNIPEKNIEEWLGETYAKASKKAKQNPEYKKQISKILKTLESDNPDKKIKEIWEKTWKASIKGFEEVFRGLGLVFDVKLYEHEYVKTGKKIVEQLVKKGIAEKSQGAIIVDLKPYNLPVLMLLKSDKNTTYATADLALAKEKFNKYEIDKSIYVVGSEQKTHFKQLFKTFELMGFKQAKKCHHLSYGLVVLPTGKMSSRQGNVVLYSDLKDELLDALEKEVEKRHDLPEKKTMNVAMKIMNASMKYTMLKIENNKQVVFDPEKATTFQGDTGPYLQYSGVRAKKILEKAEKFSKDFDNLSKEEFKLIKKIYEFPETVKESAESLKPNLIANYAMDLASLFSLFYTNCKVIGSEFEQRRANIVKAFLNVLEKCLNLMGIEIPDVM